MKLESKSSQSIVNAEQYVQQIKNLEQQLKNKDNHISAISEKIRLQCVEFDAVAVEASKKSFILKNQNEAYEEWINSLKNQVKELTNQNEQLNNSLRYQANNNNFNRRGRGRFR